LKVEVVVFWIVTPRSVVAECHTRIFVL